MWGAEWWGCLRGILGRPSKLSASLADLRSHWPNEALSLSRHPLCLSSNPLLSPSHSLPLFPYMTPLSPDPSPLSNPLFSLTHTLPFLPHLLSFYQPPLFPPLPSFLLHSSLSYPSADGCQAQTSGIQKKVTTFFKVEGKYILSL